MLLAALAISLLIHALVALYVHPWRTEGENEPIVAMRNVRIERVLPTPRAKPVHTRQPPRVPLHPPRQMAIRSHATLPAIRVARGARASNERPKSAPTPTPLPCNSADAPAAIADEPTAPPISAAVRALDVSGTAAVAVQLDSTGAVISASIAGTTGDTNFDAIALEMARDARYTPAFHACKAVASTYLFRVEFYAW